MTDTPPPPATAAPPDPAAPATTAAAVAPPDPAARPEPDARPTRPRRLLAAPRPGAAAWALLAWFLSLWPSLLPRAWLNQAAISALCAAVGWVTATTGLWAIDRARARWSFPELTSRRRRWPALGIGAGVAIVVGLVLWQGGQADQRDALGMPDQSPVVVVPMLIVSAVLLGVLVLLGRLLAALVRVVDRLVARVVPLRMLRLATATVVVATVVVVTSFGRDAFVDWADSSFGLVNEGTPDGVEAATSPSVSGGPGSLVPWDSLGAEGRRFVADVTPVAELARVAGTDDVVEPVRVYVGLDSAEDLDARIGLALAELDRTGAFTREVLVVATTTGTGWINPVGARALEHLHRGDTAIVTMQYSFLPSWIAFLVDTGGASEIGAALFDAVHGRWSTLPPDERPRLIVFGESLGSFGAEAAFAGDDLDASVGAMTTRADGVLLVGPTADNPVHTQLRDGRDAGTPWWRPGVARHPQVRVATTVDDIDARDGSWTSPRVLYLSHPTDAVGTWRPAHLVRPAGWTERPHGVGVPGATRWFPFVTWMQETFDLMAGFSAVPGYGHDYTDAFVQAWAAVVAPEGWTAADTDALDAAIDRGPGDGGSSTS